MPEWISNALYLGGGGLLAWITLLVTGRRDRRSAENQMIDQLQEELKRYRDTTDDRLAKLELEYTSARRYVFVLIQQMTDHGITPEPWPNDLPR